LKLGWHLKNLKPLLKPNLHPNSSCLKDLRIQTNHDHLLTGSK
jgi:hypothetical protein